jgi:hypothetical protein
MVKPAFYVVRDVPNQPDSAALFRIEDGRSRNLVLLLKRPNGSMSLKTGAG